MKILDDIDSGNSNISEKEQDELVQIFVKINRKELSKVEACEYIGVSKSTFNNYISKGLIPEGTKRQGFTEKFWLKSDLDKFILNSNNKYKK